MALGRMGRMGKRPRRRRVPRPARDTETGPRTGPRRGRGVPPPSAPPRLPFPAIPLVQRDASPPAPTARRPPAPHAAPPDAGSPAPPRPPLRDRLAGAGQADNAPPSRAGPDRRAVAGSLHGPTGRPGAGGGPPRPAPSRREGASQQPLLLGSPKSPFGKGVGTQQQSRVRKMPLIWTTTVRREVLPPSGP